MFRGEIPMLPTLENGKEKPPRTFSAAFLWGERQKTRLIPIANCPKRSVNYLIRRKNQVLTRCDT